MWTLLKRGCLCRLSWPSNWPSGDSVNRLARDRSVRGVRTRSIFTSRTRTAPEDLLATCDACSQWFFLIEIGKQGREILLLELPSRASIERFVRKK